MIKGEIIEEKKTRRVNYNIRSVEKIEESIRAQGSRREASVGYSGTLELPSLACSP